MPQISRTNLDPGWVALKEAFANLDRRLTHLESLEVPPTSQVQMRVGSSTSSIIVSNTFQDIPGAELQVMSGRYVIVGYLEYTSPNNTSDDDHEIQLALNINGVNDSHICSSTIRLIDGVQSFSSCISTAWNIQVPAMTILKLQVNKTGGTGGIAVGGTVAHAGCTITAIGVRTPGVLVT